MRNLKRFLAMALTVLMVVGSLSMISTSAFDDVTDYQNQINLMSTLNIVKGKDADNFDPDSDVLRWHMALWIAKIMTGKTDAYVNWYETTNYTAFEDLKVDDFYGSISYCNDNGVVIGKSATAFDPEAGITIQEAFTMAVRMLGYGSSTMDANYPWSYVNKAIELGLDNGLAVDYNNEDTATRAQAAVILYNALFAANKDGSNFAASQFNLVMKNVVLTGNKLGNAYSGAYVADKTTADKVTYVAFSVLNNDGTVDTSKTYYLPKSAFGLGDVDDATIALYFGASYEVVTADNFTSLLFYKQNPITYVDQDKLVGSTVANSTTLTIDGAAYKTVAAYTVLGNGQGTKTVGDLEINLKKNSGDDSTVKSYVRDANLNILDATGKVVLYYFTHTTTGMAYPEGIYQVQYTLANGTIAYRDPTKADWDKAATYTLSSATRYGFVDFLNTNALYAVNAYSDTMLVDDDGNGIYDRGIYTGYSFGWMSYNGDGYLTVDGNILTKAATYKNLTYIDAAKFFSDEQKDYSLTYDYVMKSQSTGKSNGNFVLYNFNTLTNIVLIKKIYTAQIGYVTTVNKPAQTITFDQVYYGYNAGTISGTTLKYGLATLPGAGADRITGEVNLDTLKGTSVYYVLDEKYSTILDVYKAQDSAGYIVFSSFANSVNTNGYINAVVYNNSNVQSVITIASINGYTNIATIMGSTNYVTIKSGDLFTATVDALGMYHLTAVDASSYNYYTVVNRTDGLGYNSGMIWSDKFAATMNANSLVIAVNNAVNNNITNYYYNGVYYNYTAKTISVKTGKGIIDGQGTIVLAAPSVSGIYGLDLGSNATDGANAAKARYFVATDSDGNVTFLYIINANLNGLTFNATAGTSVNAANTIIYADADTIASMVATNQTANGLGVSVGTVYTYKYAIDMIHGGMTAVYTSAIYNQYLQLGHYYYVTNGYVTGIADSDIKSVALVAADTYSSTALDGSTVIISDATKSTPKYVYLYSQLVDTDVLNTDGTTDVTPKNVLTSTSGIVKTPATTAAAATYYTYKDAINLGYRVNAVVVDPAVSGNGNYSGVKRVYIMKSQDTKLNPYAAANNYATPVNFTWGHMQLERYESHLYVNGYNTNTNSYASAYTINEIGVKPYTGFVYGSLYYGTDGVKSATLTGIKGNDKIAFVIPAACITDSTQGIVGSMKYYVDAGKYSVTWLNSAKADADMVNSLAAEGISAAIGDYVLTGIVPDTYNATLGAAQTLYIRIDYKSQIAVSVKSADYGLPYTNQHAITTDKNFAEVSNIIVYNETKNTYVTPIATADTISDADVFFTGAGKYLVYIPVASVPTIPAIAPVKEYCGVTVTKIADNQPGNISNTTETLVSDLSKVTTSPVIGTASVNNAPYYVVEVELQDMYSATVCFMAK